MSYTRPFTWAKLTGQASKTQGQKKNNFSIKNILRWGRRKWQEWNRYVCADCFEAEQNRKNLKGHHHSKSSVPPPHASLMFLSDWNLISRASLHNCQLQFLQLSLSLQHQLSFTLEPANCLKVVSHKRWERRTSDCSLLRRTEKPVQSDIMKYQCQQTIKSTSRARIHLLLRSSTHRTHTSPTGAKDRIGSWYNHKTGSTMRKDI